MVSLLIPPQGMWYVSDSNYDRVQKFDENGNFIARWESYGSSRWRICLDR